MGNHDLISAVNSVDRVLNDEQQRELDDALQAALEGYDCSETMEGNRDYKVGYLRLQENWARGDGDAVSSFVTDLESWGLIWRAEEDTE